MIDQPATVDLTKYVEARLFGNRPHVRGKRIPVALVARRMRANGWTVAETAFDFSLSEPEVLAALLYVQEHRAEIDQQEADEAALFDEMKQRNDEVVTDLTQKSNTAP